MECDLQAIPHRARGAIPFGDNKFVAVVEFIKRAGKLWPSGDALAGCGVGKDAHATGALQRLELPRKVLLLRAHADVADEPSGEFLFETDLCRRYAIDLSGASAFVKNLYWRTIGARNVCNFPYANLDRW
jgi:hypothetical protein